MDRGAGLTVIGLSLTFTLFNSGSLILTENSSDLLALPQFAKDIQNPTFCAVARRATSSVKRVIHVRQLTVRSRDITASSNDIKGC